MYLLKTFAVRMYDFEEDNYVKSLERVRKK